MLKRTRLILLSVAVWVALAHAQGKAPGRQNSSFPAISAAAESARDAGHLDEATSLYRRALVLHPSWVEGWWSLGTLEYDQDHYAKAARAFERLIALAPRHGTAHAMLGLCQFELGMEGPALNNLLEAEKLGVVKDAQLRKVALYHMGVLQLRARKFTAARDTLAHLASDGVHSRELTTAMGQAALLIRPQEAPPGGSADEAIVERVGEAEVQMARKQFARAKEIYGELTKEFSSYRNLNLAFGRCLLETHDVTEAVEEFQRALEHNPKDVNALLEIAAVRYQVDSKDGLQYAERAVKLSPGYPFAHYLLGLLRLDTDDAAGAIPELEIARKAFPSEATVYFSLGKAYARVGRKQEAAKARAEFVRLNALADEQPGATVYGERPSGLPGGVPQAEEKVKPNR